MVELLYLLLPANSNVLNIKINIPLKSSATNFSFTIPITKEAIGIVVKNEK